MKTLFLFVTQAQNGAPGYLSSLGEQCAENLAENLVDFFEKQLSLDLQKDFEERAKVLNHDPKWKTFKTEQHYLNSINESLKLYPKVLFLCGTHYLSQKTILPLAERLALPVNLHAHFDIFDEKKQDEHTDKLNLILEKTLQFIATENLYPHICLVITNIHTLTHWIESLQIKNPQQVVDSLNENSNNNSQPVVFICGCEVHIKQEQDKQTEIKWIIEET